MADAAAADVAGAVGAVAAVAEASGQRDSPVRAGGLVSLETMQETKGRGPNLVFLRRSRRLHTKTPPPPSRASCSSHRLHHPLQPTLPS